MVMDGTVLNDEGSNNELTKLGVRRKTALPQESLVRIFLNGELCSSMLCTPYDLKELSVGWLFNQGYIESVNDIAVMGACDDMRDIRIQLANSEHRKSAREPVIKTSACMGGEISYSGFFKDIPKLSGGPIITIAALKLLTRKTLSLADSYKATGGVHFAAIASAASKQIDVFFEDVGRHTAVDKAMGRMLLANQSPDDKVILTSGRLSSEMALKAAHGKISIIASLTTCTNLAAQIAKEAGLTVICRILKTRPIVCCGEQRIVADDEG
ncbi:MAG TPA: formate dehydrogenase accessory sulfurtransferase FdhD [Thermodesulfobacteriota bacterium]|nr:formate dehydrogenase accessory sulfurtransferase FdhD [Thermodesulfobacteriota bacterium]